MLNIEKFQFVKTGDLADGASTGQDGIYERDFGQYIVQIAISGNLMTLSYTDLSQIAARQIDVAIKYTVDTQEEFDYLIMKGRVGWLFEKEQTRGDISRALVAAINEEREYDYTKHGESWQFAIDAMDEEVNKVWSCKMRKIYDLARQLEEQLNNYKLQQ